jgi:hypothetical protein
MVSKKNTTSNTDTPTADAVRNVAPDLSELFTPRALLRGVTPCASDWLSCQMRRAVYLPGV